MIDLHTHTTASDGRLAPDALARAAWEAGVRTLAVTDHDTTAALAPARQAMAAWGIRLIEGIEITAVESERDVHVLGYFITPTAPGLARFLARARAGRIERVRAIAERLEQLGRPIDLPRLLKDALVQPGRSIGRPAVADALVRAGHAASRQQAFDEWLLPGRPAFVPRSGPSVPEVIATIREAGGIASLAHPGVTKRDDAIAAWAEAGLDALEAYHSDHAPEDTDRYLARARELGLLVTGGSDFHGEDEARGRPVERRRRLGAVTLPPADFERLEAAAVARRG
ncbi:MAG TPA: PHP domain-containing protein [Vicinamibacterales bacterium]